MQAYMMGHMRDKALLPASIACMRSGDSCCALLARIYNCLLFTTIMLCSTRAGYCAQANSPEDIQVAVIDHAAVKEESPTAEPSEMSAEALELAELTGIMPLYNTLKKEQELAKASSFSGDTIESLTRKQRILYLRTKIGHSLETANLEVSAMLGTLNSGMAQLDRDKAQIADERARILRRNSVINLVSGGLTKVGGYSAALTPASLIGTNVLEVFDGTVQVGLSHLTLRQQRNESKVSKNTPIALTCFVVGRNQELNQYPDIIWNYLNRPPANSTKSRRSTLINNWLTSYPAFRRAYPAGGINLNSHTRMSMEDLDETVAMMSDLKSLIGAMNESLVELSQVLKKSFSFDPEF